MMNFISLGAGVQSTGMALMAKHGEIEPMPDGAIFADTGAEPARVYEHLEWLIPQLPFPVHVVQYSDLRQDTIDTAAGKSPVAGRVGGYLAAPFHTRNEDGSEGLLRRECTTNYKIRPIQRKVKELLGRDPNRPIRAKEPLARQWIGISTDEWQRAKDNWVNWIENWHPFLERERWMSRSQILGWLRKHDYPHPPKSSCTFCPYHSAAQWRFIREDPEDWKDALYIDALIRDMPRDQRAGLREGGQLFLHRDCIPLEEADIDKGAKDQLDLWAGECEGMCGV